MNNGAILILLNTLISGGAEKQAIWAAGRIAQAGQRVVIYELKFARVPNRLEPLLQKAAECGVCVVRGNPSYSLGMYRLLKLFLAERFTLVWSWGFRADSAAFFFRLLFAGRWRWWTSLRCADWVDLWKKRFPHALYHMWADKAVSNTISNVIMIREMLHVPLKSDVLNNVIALPGDYLVLPVMRPNRLSIAMLGNIKVIHKGYDVILDVVEMLKASRLPVILHIAGREDDGGWLRQNLELRGLGEWCVMHGEVNRPEHFLKQHHAYLLCSRFEGMPNSLLEAMALGLPCICSRVSDVGLVFGDGQAKLFSPVRAEECFNAIVWLVDHWDHAKYIAESGRAFCRSRFSEDFVGNVLFRLMASLCSDEARAP